VLLSFLYDQSSKKVYNVKLPCLLKLYWKRRWSIPEVSKAAFAKPAKKISLRRSAELSKARASILWQQWCLQLWNWLLPFRSWRHSRTTPIVKRYRRNLVFKYRLMVKVCKAVELWQMYDTSIPWPWWFIRYDRKNLVDSAVVSAWCRAEGTICWSVIMLFALCFSIDGKEVEFCFRMKKNWWKVVKRFITVPKKAQL